MTYVIGSMTYVIFIYFSKQTNRMSEQNLIFPCEVAVKSVVPAIKALMARELVEKQGLKQEEAAEILGISQSAVSKYSTRARGYALEVDRTDEVQSLIGNMTTLLLDGTDHRTEFMQLFCETCMTIRKAGSMCMFCRKSDPKIKLENCSFCTNLKSASR
jgi:predicted transcriptional regulator